MNPMAMPVTWNGEKWVTEAPHGSVPYKVMRALNIKKVKPPTQAPPGEEVLKIKQLIEKHFPI